MKSIASLFSVRVVIKNLLVSRQNLPVLCIMKSEDLFLRGKGVSLLLWSVHSNEGWKGCLGNETHTAVTKGEELSPHGLKMAFMLLALNSLESGRSGNISIR